MLCFSRFGVLHAHSLPAKFPWMPGSRVTLDSWSKVTEARGISPRKILALIDASDQHIGLQWPRSCYLRSRCIQAPSELFLQQWQRAKKLGHICLAFQYGCWQFIADERSLSWRVTRLSGAFDFILFIFNQLKVVLPLWKNSLRGSSARHHWADQTLKCKNCGIHLELRNGMRLGIEITYVDSACSSLARWSVWIWEIQEIDCANEQIRE